MIKKLLGTLIILGLGFFGISFGDYGYGTIGNSVTSQLNSSYSVSVLNNVEFSTTYLGSLKRVFAFDGDSVFYWNLDGTLSIGFDYWDNKGDIGYFFVCDYISSFDGTFSNCVGYDYSENIDIINNFLTKIKSTDKFVYGGSSGTSETNYLMYIGVISSEVNKTIVFPFGICWSNCSSPLNIDGIDFNGLDDFEVLGNPYYDSHYYIGLNNLSEGGYSFSTIPNDIIGVSPAFNNNNGGNEGNTGTLNNWTGNNYYCPTFKQILENQPNNYNTGLCYNGTLKYENGAITTVQKKDIQTVFTDYDEFTQRINVYYNNCNTPATQSQCENAFNGEREKYSIIANAINNNVDDKGLWNYCNIWLNYDLNATTCVASGYIAEQPTGKELIEYIENIGNIGEIMTPTTGNVLDSLIGSGTTRENREELANRDIFGQLNQIKDKITSIFENRNGVNGIIPNYILRLILVSLLLTVLLKK